MIEVFVFLFFHRLVRGRNQRLTFSEVLGELAEQLPVQMVLRLGVYDAFGRYDLRRLRVSRSSAISIALTSDVPM